MFFSKILVGLFSLFQNGYKENLEFIKTHNSKNLSYEVGITPFINNSYVNGTTNKSSHYIYPTTFHINFLSDKDLPDRFDWREKGAVSSVKNQLQCGSCWAFSATEAIEGEWFLKHKQLYNLSEQELVDCSGYLGNMGCEGGTMDAGFKYVIQNGLCLNKSYPYNASDNVCQNQTCVKHVHIDTYFDVPHNNEIQLKKAVTQQPVSVAIQANLQSFQLYKKGVYSDPQCGTDLDHGVLLIGYGYAENDDENDDNLEYWIIKNSWGENWGEKGYMRLLKNTDDPSGLCGIAMEPSYPVIKYIH